MTITATVHISSAHPDPSTHPITSVHRYSAGGRTTDHR